MQFEVMTDPSKTLQLPRSRICAGCGSSVHSAMLFFLDGHATGQRVSITGPYSTADLLQHSQMKSDHARHTQARCVSRQPCLNMNQISPGALGLTHPQPAYFPQAVADDDKALFWTIKSDFFVSRVRSNRPALT